MKKLKEKKGKIKLSIDDGENDLQDEVRQITRKVSVLINNFLTNLTIFQLSFCNYMKHYQWFYHW